VAILTGSSWRWSLVLTLSGVNSSVWIMDARGSRALVERLEAARRERVEREAIFGRAVAAERALGESENEPSQQLPRLNTPASRTE
jgi:hypothetical protein